MGECNQGLAAWSTGWEGSGFSGRAAQQRSQDSTEELGGIPRLCCRVGRSHMGYICGRAGPIQFVLGLAELELVSSQYPPSALGAGKVLITHLCFGYSISTVFSNISPLPQ